MDDSDGSFGTEFPAAMGKVSRRALFQHGYTDFEHLATATPKELLRIHGVGPRAIRILGEELAARGLRFRDA